MDKSLLPFYNGTGNQFARSAGVPSPDLEIELRIILHHHVPKPDEIIQQDNLLSESPSQRQYLSLEQLKEVFGISEEDHEEHQRVNKNAILTPDRKKRL